MGNVSIQNMAIHRLGNEYFRVGSCSMQGFRDNNEDAHAISLQLKESSRMAYFGLFDGHCGHEASIFGGKELHKHIASLPKLSNRALEQAFLRCDNCFDHGHAGSTVLTALVEPSTEDGFFDLIICNAGDSRAIIINRDGSFDQVTTDHRPSCSTEQLRIVNAGAVVTNKRINNALGVARGLGDRMFKSVQDLPPHLQPCTIVPDIFRLKVPSGSLLLLGCDGLFETLSTSDVCTCLMSSLADCENDLAAALCQVFENNNDSKDNMSALLIELGVNGKEYGPRETFQLASISQNQRDTEAFMLLYKNNLCSLGFPNSLAKALIADVFSSPSPYPEITYTDYPESVSSLLQQIEVDSNDNPSFEQLSFIYDPLSSNFCMKYDNSRVVSTEQHGKVIFDSEDQDALDLVAKMRDLMSFAKIKPKKAAKGSSPIADPNGVTELHSLIHDNKLPPSSLLVSTEVNAMDWLGATPLHIAVANNNIPVLLPLLNTQNIKIPAFDNFGWSPLSEAVHRGSVDIIDILLCKGYQIDTSAHIFTAIMRCDLRLLRCLLSHGCDPNFLKRGSTSLHEAVSHTPHSGLDSRPCSVDSEIVQTLIDYNVNVDALNELGSTSLHLAAVHNQHLALILLNNGADARIKDKNGWSALHLAAACSIEDNELWSRLIIAIVQSFPDLVNATGDKGDTPLHYAQKRQIVIGSDAPKSFVAFLVKHGANVNSVNNAGQTPLHTALKRTAGPINDLINSNADPSITDNEGMNAVHFAALHPNVGFISLLNRLDMLAPLINSRTHSGMTPLLLCFCISDRSASSSSLSLDPKILLKYGADLFAVNNSGDTAMHLAMKNHAARHIKLIVERGGASLAEVKNSEGKTPANVNPSLSKFLQMILNKTKHNKR